MLVGLGQSSLVSQMAAAITKVEGYFPPGTPGYPNGSVAYQNNNPGNLMYAGQAGASPGGAAGFAKFDTLADGQAALNNQIQSQINKGQNLQQFFYQYAPPNTSNAAGAQQTQSATDAYIATVSQQLGIGPSVPLNQVQTGNYSPSSDSSGSSDASNGGTFSDLVASAQSSLSNIDLSDPTTDAVLGVVGLALIYLVFG